MGAKSASIHFRSDKPDSLLPVLKEQFNKKDSKKSKPDLQQTFIAKMIRSKAQKGIDKIIDEAEKSKAIAALEMLIEVTQGDFTNLDDFAQYTVQNELNNTNSEEKKNKIMADIPKAIEETKNSLKIQYGGKQDNDKAIIVIREHFISLYWYDNIRVDNLDKTLHQYASIIKTPTLGVAVYDDSNFIILALNVQEHDAKEIKGSYWFEHNDIQPVKAGDLCDILDADFLLEALTDTLSCSDGESMTESFEQKTGIPIYLDADLCIDGGMSKIVEWSGADLFSTKQR